MQDRILEGYVKDFSGQYGLEELAPASLFSYFVNYCVVSRLTAAALSLDDFDVDGGQDLGIDAIAILINGRAVNAKEAVDHFRDRLGRLSVEFVFIQSKSSPKFDGGDIGTFLLGVKQFFAKAPSLQSNADIAAFHELKEYVFDNCILKAMPRLETRLSSLMIPRPSITCREHPVGAQHMDILPPNYGSSLNRRF